jgi:hypothetical protein
MCVDWDGNGKQEPTVIRFFGNICAGGQCTVLWDIFFKRSLDSGVADDQRRDVCSPPQEFPENVPVPLPGARFSDGIHSGCRWDDVFEYRDQTDPGFVNYTYFGLVSDLPLAVPTGDPFSAVGVFRPSEARWYVMSPIEHLPVEYAGATASFDYGESTDAPLVWFNA